MGGMHMGMPNLVGVLPGVTAGASAMMKSMIKNKGVASLEDLRDMCVDLEIRMIACQMTLDLFEIKKEDLIDGVELGGAATYMESALNSEINLYI
jgi:peroxiredoxin family protein